MRITERGRIARRHWLDHAIDFQGLVGSAILVLALALLLIALGAPTAVEAISAGIGLIVGAMFSGWVFACLHAQRDLDAEESARHDLQRDLDADESARHDHPARVAAKITARHLFK